MRIARIVMAAVICVVGISPGYASPDDEFKFFLAGAYPFSLGTTHQYVNGEFGIVGGFRYQAPDWPVALQFEGMTYRFGFNDHASSLIGSDGYTQMTAGTANVVWEPKKAQRGRLKPYTIGGTGVYNRVDNTTETKLYGGTCFDPWWGYYPCTGTGNVVTNSQSQTKLGFNGGGGLAFELNGGSEFFVELRYHHVFTTQKDTQFMPINIGFLW